MSNEVRVHAAELFAVRRNKLEKTGSGPVLAVHELNETDLVFTDRRAAGCAASKPASAGLAA
jgi:hypothetical protein